MIVLNCLSILTQIELGLRVVVHFCLRSMHPPISRTVCIVDDDAQVRRFLGEVLSSVGLLIDDYPSGEDFLRRWRPGNTGCILLDIRMPRVTGPEVHDWVRQQAPDLPVIFLSGYADVPTAVRAMKLGAFDFIEKPFNVQHLIERVNAALGSVRENLPPVTLQPGREGWQSALTPREREILDRIVSGKRNKAIAFELDISERTVETHRANLMAKAGASNVAELVALALAGGLRGPSAA